MTALLGWGAAVTGGFASLAMYHNAPGGVGVVPTTLDTGLSAELDLTRSRPSVTLFAHPGCVCTSATAENLYTLADAEGAEDASWIVVVRQPASGELWTRPSWLDGLEARFEGLRVVNDTGGALASRFGAQTSGHVLAYGRDGELLFSGGVTPSRGHVGGSGGLAGVRAALKGRLGSAAGGDRFTVFGCALHEPGAVCADDYCGRPATGSVTNPARTGVK